MFNFSSFADLLLRKEYQKWQILITSDSSIPSKTEYSVFILFPLSLPTAGGACQNPAIFVRAIRINYKCVMAGLAFALWKVAWSQILLQCTQHSHLWAWRMRHLIFCTLAGVWFWTRNITVLHRNGKQNARQMSVSCKAMLLKPRAHGQKYAGSHPDCEG